jgi:hypothetical protein
VTERQKLVVSIANTTADYRKGEVPTPTPEHVDRWVKQFDSRVQLRMLREIDHVLKKTYFSLERVVTFLCSLMKAKDLVGSDPCAFWRGVTFLDIQKGGNSQTEMIALFGELLAETCGFDIDKCGKPGKVFVYLDDAIFTGNRVRRDLEAWIANDSPAEATLHIISLALHSGGQYYANRCIRSAAKAAKKDIAVTWWRAIEMEDRKAYTAQADVLRPTMVPNDPDVLAYVAGMKYPPVLRKPGATPASSLFSSEQARSLLEIELLTAGVRIRNQCPNLGNTQRPLGHMTLDTLGFGSLIVTFRNCPNNAPLALWVGDPWYPLFPRTTNSQTAVSKLFKHLMQGGD